MIHLFTAVLFAGMFFTGLARAEVVGASIDGIVDQFDTQNVVLILNGNQKVSVARKLIPAKADLRPGAKISIPVNLVRFGEQRKTGQITTKAKRITSH